MIAKYLLGYPNYHLTYVAILNYMTAIMSIPGKWTNSKSTTLPLILYIKQES